MVVKADFTFEEWITLRAVLDSALLNVALADKVLRIEEPQTWGRLSMYAIPLIQELLLRGMSPDEDQAVVEKASHVGLHHLIAEALEILQRRATPEEIADFSRTLRALTRAVAESNDEIEIKEARFLDRLDDLLREWEA